MANWEKGDVIPYNEILSDLPRQNNGSVEEWIDTFNSDVLAASKEVIRLAGSDRPVLDGSTEQWIKDFDAATLAVSKRIVRRG